MASTGTLRPTGDGADDGTDWTKGTVNCATGDCYTEVDEATADDDTTTASFDKDLDTAGARQSWTFDNSGVTDGATIDSIKVSSRHRKQGGGPNSTPTLYVKVGGTNYDGAALSVPATYQLDEETITVGAAKAAVEAGIIEGGGKDFHATQIYIDINYTEGAGGIVSQRLLIGHGL